jgi:uncharacterized protein
MDWGRPAELVWQYSELPLGTVDASVVVVARLEEITIATLERRHLSAVRPRHAPAFDLVPQKHRVRSPLFRRWIYRVE